MISKPGLKTLIIGLAGLIVGSQSLITNAAELIPINFLLLAESCPVTKLQPGYSAGQQSIDGGRTYYYDIHTIINGGDSVYLTSIPTVGNKGNDSGYLFSFFPEDSTQYKFQAIGSDSKGLKGLPSEWSTPFQVQHEVKNQKTATSIVADPGQSQIVQSGTEVVLDGSESYDPTDTSNTNLVYRWECYQSPALVTLSEAATAHPRFTPTDAGSYKFRLVVSRQQENSTDQQAGSQSPIRYVQIQVVENFTNVLKANVGVPLQVALGEKIVLDGSLSLPSVEDNGRYKWELLNGEQLDTNIVINNDSLPVANAFPEKVGTHVFRLTVMNSNNFSYQITAVSVYDPISVGSLIEQDITKGCDLDCSIADLNDDQQIDNEDLDLFNSSINSGKGESAYIRIADFDKNLQINSNDLKVMNKCISKPLSSVKGK